VKRTSAKPDDIMPPGIARLLAFAFLLAPHTDAAEISFIFAEDRVEYRGAIDARVVDRLIEESKDRSPKRLVIDSIGGGVAAAVRLGEWVLDNGMDVEVQALCASSCANYVLPAGTKKVIRQGAMIVWHGGADQRDFREERRAYELLQARLLFEPLDWSESTTFELRTARYQGLRQATEAQRRFYKRIGADEGILLLGQEPELLGNGQWTLTVAAMSRFGISGVEAPDNFGSTEYVDAWLTKHGARSSIVSLHVDAKGGIAELKPVGK